MNLRTQLHNQLTIAPGVFDGLSARLAEQAGFSMLYASGGAMARSSGYPDLGLITLDEVLFRLRALCDVVNVPVIADADAGFGNHWNVERTVHLFEQSGVAGLHLEDQVQPKRCGHLAGKQLISTEEMCLKLQTALRARKNDDLLIIARTDAIAVEGFESALTRAKAYIDAGAEMIFVEAPTTLEQIETIGQLPGLKLINMFQGGKTPMVPPEQLQAWGFHLVIIPSDLQRACIHAMQQTLSTIRKDGHSGNAPVTLTSFREREEIIGSQRYLDE